MKNYHIDSFMFYCYSSSSALDPNFGVQPVSRNAGVEKFLISLANSGKIENKLF